MDFWSQLWNWDYLVPALLMSFCILFLVLIFLVSMDIMAIHDNTAATREWADQLQTYCGLRKH